MALQIKGLIHMDEMLRVLIVEDTPERQDILKNLVKDHAWFMINSAKRAIRLIKAFEFDVIFLDYDLDGIERGDSVAAAIRYSRNNKTKVIVHSMNSSGAELIGSILPHAEAVPLSKIIRNNSTSKRLRHELKHGTDIDWAFVFSSKRKK